VIVVDGVLDSLDAETLARLVTSRKGILAGVTIITVTNQPLIAGYADTVVVLDGGAVVESGPPEDLLAADGHFAALMRRWRSGLTSTA
jgi:ABC-type multidrug transport system fused ATPase/permease subunit